MPRLSGDTRSQIANAVIAHAFNDRCVDLRSRQAALAMEVYAFSFTAAQRKLLKEAPSGWFPMEAYIYYALDNGEYGTLYFSGDFSRYSHNRDWRLHAGLDDVMMPMPSCFQSSAAVNMEASSPLAHKLVDFFRDAEAIKEEMTTAYRKTVATIESFSTSEKLVAGWPEIAPFIPERSKPENKLPAVPTDDLNKMLGLAHV